MEFDLRIARRELQRPLSLLIGCGQVAERLMVAACGARDPGIHWRGGGGQPKFRERIAVTRPRGQQRGQMKPVIGIGGLHPDRAPDRLDRPVRLARCGHGDREQVPAGRRGLGMTDMGEKMRNGRLMTVLHEFDTGEMETCLGSLRRDFNGPFGEALGLIELVHRQQKSAQRPKN